MVSYFAIAILSVGLLAVSPQTPVWEASYGKALKATRSENSPLLVVLDEPDSDEARLEPELLGENEDSVSKKEIKLLRPYRLCHVDVTTKYGRRVAKAFRAKRFPHVAIIDRTGSRVIFRKTGKIEVKEWEQILDEHKTGEIKATQVSRTTLKPAEGSGNPAGRPDCPNCQRNSF